MTIATTATSVQYVRNGITTQWSYPNKVFSAADLVVIDLDTSVPPVVTALILGTDYTVSNVDVDTGCLVNTTVPGVAGHKLDIRSGITQNQLTSIKNQGSYLPELHEEFFDRISRIVQDLTRKAYTFSISGPDTESVPWSRLPAAATRANTGLIFDGSGNPTVGVVPTVTFTQGLWDAYLAATVNLYKLTGAETLAGVTPTSYAYQEGDIRRYGALIASSDNSPAINAALAVSGAGGRAAFIPGGAWKTAAVVIAAPLSSMYGVGNASIINPAFGFDGLSLAADTSSYAVTGTARFFRDFQIVGTLVGGTTINSGLICNYTVASGNQVTGIDFRNIWITHFRVGVYMRQLKNSNFYGMFLYDCFLGMYLNGQVITVSFDGCNIERGTITGPGNSAGYSFLTVAGESVENTHVRGGQVYNYDIGVNVALAFELQLEHMDISQSQVTGVAIGSTNGGFWLRDCWIEMTNASAVTGVSVGAITPSISGNVNIINNYINNDTPFAGSQGINVGNSNVGCLITENKVIGFDQGITLGASAGQICKDNKVNCVTSVYSAASYAVNYQSTIAPDNVCGPNYIAPGTAQAATMANASANIGVTSSAAFPVGTPVTFSNAVNGFFALVTYYVLTSAANVITVSAVPSGAAVVATGNTAINVSPAPLPLTTVAGIPTVGFQFFARGSFIGALSGFTTTVSGPIDWMANGYTCTVNQRAATTLQGTSNATTMTLAGLPGFLTPVTTQVFAARVADNSTGYVLGSASLNSAGVWTFFKDMNGGAFTAANIKGLNEMPMTYTFT